MLNLPRNSLNLIKKYLLRQQRQVEKNLEEVEKDDPATTPALAETSEPGTDSWVAEAHTRTIALKEQLKALGGSIGAALVRIKNGTYGVCLRCKKRIETSRLLAMPTAQYCLSCSKKVTRQR